MATNSQGNNITKTISMETDMGNRAESRARDLGYRSFSAYVQNLIRTDLLKGGDQVVKHSREEKVNSRKTAEGLVASETAKIFARIRKDRAA